MRPDAPYFIILLCLTSDDFTHQAKSVAKQVGNLSTLTENGRLISSELPFLCRTAKI